MESNTGFSIGGALGAALGYLLSQKNMGAAQQVGPTASPPTEPAAVPASPLVVAPTVLAPTPTVYTPEWTVLPTPSVAVPPAPPADWRPAPVAEPVVPETPAPVAAPVVPPAPAAPAFAAPVMPTATAPPVVPIEPMVRQEVAPVVEPPESVVIVTREFLEEPVPGTGWRSSAPSAVDGETFEIVSAELPVREEISLIEPSEYGPEILRPPLAGVTVPAVAPVAEPAVQGFAGELPVLEESAVELPVVEDIIELPAVEQVIELAVVEEAVTYTAAPAVAETQALAQAADVAGRMPAVEIPLVDDSWRVDDLKSRIEETRRRIRHELEQPFDTSAPARPLERDWTSAPAVPVVEPTVVPEPLATGSVPVAPVTVAPLRVEPLQSETPPAAPVEVAPPAREPVAVAPMASSPMELEQVLVEPLPLEQVVVEPLAFAPVVPAPAVSAPAEFAPAVPAPAVPAPAVPAPVVPEVPVVTPEPIARPIAAEPVVVTPEPSPEPETLTPAAVALPVELEVETLTDDATVDSGLEEPVDYDSMKNRIESTRSRLKAKAFDAMMTGEAALLGRDVGGASRASSAVSGVDSDIDETIETSLREEEA